MIQINNKQQKTMEQHIKDALIEFEKDLLNFQLSLQTKDRTIIECVRLLNLTRTEYQKILKWK